jgi:hypothetical protein
MFRIWSSSAEGSIFYTLQKFKCEKNGISWLYLAAYSPHNYNSMHLCSLVFYCMFLCHAHQGKLSVQTVNPSTTVDSVFPYGTSSLLLSTSSQNVNSVPSSELTAVVTPYATITVKSTLTTTSTVFVVAATVTSRVTVTATATCTVVRVL